MGAWFTACRGNKIRVKILLGFCRDFSIPVNHAWWPSRAFDYEQKLVIKKIVWILFPETILGDISERYQQRSAGTFPTGLPDEEIMLEILPVRPDRVDTWIFNGYRSGLGVPVVFQYLFIVSGTCRERLCRERLLGTFPSISGYQ